MAQITYPVTTVVDDNGTIVTGATVTIASVALKDGTAVSSHGATVNLSGADASVDYDAELKGDAWIVLSVSKSGSTFTGLNAAPRIFATRDPQRIGVGFSATGALATDALSAAAVSSAAVTKIAAGVATPSVPTAAQNAAAVWDLPRSGHATAGTFGEYLDAAVSTRSTFAGGAVASVMGNVGGNVNGNVIGTVGSVTGAVGSVTAAVTVGGYSSGQDPATLVLDATASGHNGANSVGAKINSAAASGDPWATVLPGSYVSGTAGNILGNRAGFFLAAAGLDAVTIESGINARQALALIGAACAGKASGLDTSTATYYAMGASGTATARIVGTTDSSGNRSATTLTVPA